MKKIGVLGSSFNPPTLGHLDVIKQAATQVDEILLVPSIAHAFGKQLAPIDERLNMLTLLLKDCPDTIPIHIVNIEPSIQSRLSLDKPVYTYDVLTALDADYQSQNQAVRLHFIMGPDLAVPEVWQKFYRHEEIENKWPRIIVDERQTIHSSAVRAMIQKHQAGDLLLDELTPLVGAHIAAYLISHKLYRI